MYLTAEAAREIAREVYRMETKNTLEAQARRASKSTSEPSTTAQDATATRLAELEKQVEQERAARRGAILDSSLRGEMLSAGIDPKRADAAMLIFKGKHGAGIEWDGDAAFVRDTTGVTPAAEFAKRFAASPEHDYLRAPRATPGSVKQSIGGTGGGTTITQAEFSRAAQSGTPAALEMMKKVSAGQISIAN